MYLHYVGYPGTTLLSKELLLFLLKHRPAISKLLIAEMRVQLGEEKMEYNFHSFLVWDSKHVSVLWQSTEKKTREEEKKR